MRKRINGKNLFLSTVVILLLMIAGCGTDLNDSGGATGEHTTGNPDAEEILSMDPDADIFQYDDLIYKTGIDWVEEKSLTKDKQIGEIIETNDKGTNFENGTANKLPVGSKIFTTKEESKMFLLVESEGKILKYYALVEG